MVGRDTAAAIAINSGARGNVSQMNTAVEAFGVQQDAGGRAIELPIVWLHRRS